MKPKTEVQRQGKECACIKQGQEPLRWVGSCWSCLQVAPVCHCHAAPICALWPRLAHVPSQQAQRLLGAQRLSCCAATAASQQAQRHRLLAAQRRILALGGRVVGDGDVAPDAQQRALLRFGEGRERLCSAGGVGSQDGRVSPQA